MLSKRICVQLQIRNKKLIENALFYESEKLTVSDVTGEPTI